jgi:hypothetical protein
LLDFSKAANLSAFIRPENWSILPDFIKAENWSVLTDFTKPVKLSDFTRAENWSVLYRLIKSADTKNKSSFLIAAGYISQYEKYYFCIG